MKGASAVLACAIALAGLPAHAGTPDVKIAPSISIEAKPVFGSDAATGNGWFEIVANIDNGGALPVRGTVELAASSMYGAGELETSARAPFNVPAGHRATVKIPTHGFPYYVPQMTVTALGENGAKLATMTVTVNGTSGPLLVDVDQPSRLGIMMRSWPILASWNPGSTGMGYASSALTVGSPSFDRTTGDPILPDRAAGYASVTALVIHSDTLVGLEEAKLDALIGWVIAGGSLAIVPARPEDLRSPLLATLAGGSIRPTAPAPALMKAPVLERPSSVPSIGSATPPTDEEGNPSGSPSTPTARALRYGPTPAVREKLAGYAGGNLRPSDLGATAPYGAGEVHLLAFDPTTSPMLDDPWVHSRIVAMVTRAWDRRATQAFPHGGGDRAVGRMDEVRRSLDPNENFRLGLGISAILLVLYSLVAGPLTFMRAAKRGKPMAPLVWAPVWSAIAFSTIVVVGLAGKGWRGRARHISLIEASGGFSRGTVRRFRGFFASEARSLAVQGADRASVLEVAPTDGGKIDYGVLRFDRNGVTLGDLTSLPWQTVVVREDGFADLKGGITLWPAPDGSISIVNRSGRILKDVLLHAPGGDLVYFTTIADGETAKVSDGRALTSSATSPPTHTQPAGLKSVHPLGASTLRYMMSGREGERVAAAWEPLENAAGETVDWWPDDQPALIGEMIGGNKASKDAGLALESDRVMFRIVGTGGTP